MMEIAVAGATGRMGRAVLEAVGCDDGLTVSAALTRSEDPLCGSSIRVGDAEIAIVDKLGTSCEVMIDFSTAQGTVEWDMSGASRIARGKMRREEVGLGSSRSWRANDGGA